MYPARHIIQQLLPPRDTIACEFSWRSSFEGAFFFFGGEGGAGGIFESARSAVRLVPFGIPL